MMLKKFDSKPTVRRSAPHYRKCRFQAAIHLLVVALVTVLLTNPSLLSADQITRSAAELEQLEQQIDKLTSKLAGDTDRSDSLTSELNKIEQRLADIGDSIRESQRREDGLVRELGQLERQSVALQEESVDAERRLGKLLKSGYMLGRQSGLRMLISQQDPHKAARRMAMFRYVIAARNEQLAEIASLTERTKENRSELTRRRDALESVRQALLADERQLDDQRAERDAEVARLKSTIGEGEARLEVWRERQEDLSELISTLRQPVKEPVVRSTQPRRPQLKPAPVSPDAGSRVSELDQGGSVTAVAEQDSRPVDVKDDTITSAASQSVETTVQSADEQSVVADDPVEAQTRVVTLPGGFGKNRGQLPRPLDAKIAARFGDRREAGGLEWQGILFGARSGQAVRAVYPGQVVFSDWFRGFGQLMVVDHGDGYMSLYGHNRSLNAGVGEVVSAGQVIAGASDASDVPVAGLYFEIRHNGAPDDPLQWIR